MRTQLSEETKNDIEMAKKELDDFINFMNDCTSECKEIRKKLDKNALNINDIDELAGKRTKLLDKIENRINGDIEDIFHSLESASIDIEEGN